MKKYLLLLLALAAVSLPASAQKKPLTQSAYDSWNRIGNTAVSDDGTWICYTIRPLRGDGTMGLYNVKTGKTVNFDRGYNPTFFNSGKWFRFFITPTFEEKRQAELKDQKNKTAEDSLVNTGTIIRLSDMKEIRLPQVRTFASSPRGPIVAYSYSIDGNTAPADAKKGKKQEEAKPSASPARKSLRLVIFDTEKNDSVKVDDVAKFIVHDNGEAVMYSIKSKSKVAIYLRSYDKDRSATTVELWSAPRGAVDPGFLFDRAGKQGAFLATSDTVSNALYDLYYFSTTDPKPAKVASKDVAGLPAGYAISRYGSLTFSRDGKMLRFNIAPKPLAAFKPEKKTKEETFDLDIWSWNDTILMTEQLHDPKKIAQRSYPAAYFTDNDRALALGDSNLDRFFYADNGTAPYAVGSTSKPYELFTENVTRPYKGNDNYLVDLKTGERKLFRTNGMGNCFVSPSAKYVAYYNYKDKSMYVLDTKTMQHTRVGGDIPWPLWDEEEDVPRAPGLYGAPWWTKEEKLLVLDKYDLWMVDPAGVEKSVNLTVGRDKNTRFRLVNGSGGRYSGVVDVNKAQTFESFNLATRDGGYWERDENGAMSMMVEGSFRYNLLATARRGGRVVFTRENFTEVPDLWTADKGFLGDKKITNSNPQKDDYKWGTVELIKWKDEAGIEREGLLYKPDDYDPAKKYPVIVYFYERLTDALNRFRSPRPSASTINPSYCVSNGYVVFMPDIYYKAGHPGKSACDAVISGAKALIDRGIADPARIGLNGQSWGGYQSAYIVTQTDMFACSAPGAAVVNMTSAYGGIRWESGRSRVYQYEDTQSRIGATLWQNLDLYIENSPLFHLDKVNTPQLLRHSDQDGAVPWYQGIEFYIGLRRLGKTAWLLNYVGDKHNLENYGAKMDWDVRMYQFFDHYLKGAPMPRWMQEGVSVTEKGRDPKLDLVR